MKNHLQVLAATFLGLLALSACSDGESTTSAITTDPVQWTVCDEYPDEENIECGTLTVPLDYSDIGGESIELALIRVPAQSKDPQGILLSNPGGPGESGIDFVYNWSFEFVDSLGLEDFDVVGFDPRGVGRSGGLSCLSDQQNDKFLYLDYTPDDEREQALYDEWMAIDEPCTEKYGDSLRFYSTKNTARDMDLIRQSLGFEKINYLGISYGTYLGGVYATLFPDRVESMFLDSAYDPQGDTPEQDYLTQAEGFENSFNNWVDWCESTPRECSFSSSDVKSDWLAIYNAFDLESAFTDDSREANGVVIDIATTSALYTKYQWSQLADALTALRDGDATQILEMADLWTGREDDGTFSDGYDSFNVVNCASGTNDDEPKDPNALLKNLKEVAPWYTRDYEVDWLSGGYCESVFNDAKLFEVDYQGDAPIVVLGGTDDPSTPLRWAEELVSHVGSRASLLTFNGEGHSQIFISRCVDEVAGELFKFGRKPDGDIECNADSPVVKPVWWDDVITLDGGDIDQDTMNYYFGSDPVDSYGEYFEVEGSATDVFDEVKAAFEANGWVYEEGDSADPVTDPQWFINPDDESEIIGVLISSPEELAENKMVKPIGIVSAGSSVVLLYYWP